MKSVHLVIPDLFLPKDFAAEVCAGLSLPALQKLLARGRSEMLEPVPLENMLCELFGVPCHPEAPIAPISAAYDGLAAGCWLRADPVHLRLQRDQMLLLPNVDISADEAGEMCASLNEHFAGQGMEFFAPHPLRWYAKFDVLPDIKTVPMSQTYGRDVQGMLPRGAEAMHWHQLFNEIQMLLHGHPLNEAREARAALPIHSVWLWGCGCSENTTLQKNYDIVSSDDVSAKMFAAASGVPFYEWSEQWREEKTNGKQLLVWTSLQSALQRGDLAAWRTAMQNFESGYAQPLWQMLRSGKVAYLQLDILGGDNIRRVRLARNDTWAFWRRAKH